MTYEKKYEDVYTSDRCLKKCDITKVGTDVEWDTGEYIGILRSTIYDFQKNLFDYLVKATWLFKRFCYNGKNRDKLKNNGAYMDGAFGVFMRQHANIDQRIITHEWIYSIIVGYLDDFFPDFNVLNPFTDEYKYPYKYMKFECLSIVHRMPERLVLLQHGEEQCLNYLDFCDYVINYVKCYNDEHEILHYIWKFPHKHVHYVDLSDEAKEIVKKQKYEDRRNNSRSKAKT